MQDDLASRLAQAANAPESWDVPGLLRDAAAAVAAMASAGEFYGDTTAYVATVIRECSRPTSIIAEDLIRRLRAAHERMAAAIETAR